MKKIFFLVIYLFCFFSDVPIFGMGFRCRNGCRNQKACGYTGNVAAEEPFCETCEVEQYPDRFVTCLICRKPLRQVSVWGRNFNSHYPSRCYECSERVKSFLVDALLVTDAGRSGFQKTKHKEALEKGIERYFRWADLAFKMKYIQGLRAYRPHKDIFRSVNSGVAKPHFYLGAKLNEAGKFVHIWSQELVIEPADKKFVLDVEEAYKHVAQIWLKYKFFGPETGTLIEKDITDKMVTYQEGTVFPQIFDDRDDESD